VGLEEELKQRRYVNIHQKAHLNVLFSANWLITQTKEVLKPYDITHQQFNVLKILKGKYPNTCAVHDIKEVMIDRGPDLTRLLNRLIKKGYVTRNVCEENRRKLDIAITEEGIKLIKEIDPKLKKQFIDHPVISEEEANELNRILDKMRS